MESSHYIERDVSWMYFNHRILQEAEKEKRSSIGTFVVFRYLF